MANPQHQATSAARMPIALAVAVAVGVVVPAGLLTGAFAPPVDGLGDAGAIVRWGLPIARVCHDLAASLTVGLLVLAATIIPEARRTSRRITATRWACASGVVWVVAGLVGIIFSFSDISATKVSDSAFAAQFQAVALEIPVIRAAAISLALALVVTTGAAITRSRAGMVALAALSVVAILPLALAGHAAGVYGHDTAVNSLAVHLVAATLWVGALAGLAVLRPVLGNALAVSVARYSALAGWCFVAVAVSGVLNAWARIGGFDGLASRYGVLVILKAAALVLLGLAGWRQRTAIVGRLASSEPARRAFATLAILEIAVMAAAFGLAVALSRSAPPVPATVQPDLTPAQSLTGYPAPAGPLTSAGWFTVWRVDWLWLSVALVAVGLYAAGVVRLRRRGDRWPVSRTICWVAGWGVFVWVTNGAPDVYGRLLFSVHMTMHMTLSMGTPILLVLAAPATLALRTLPARTDKTLGPRELLLGLLHSRYLAVVANPIVAAVIFFGGLVAFYYSGLFELALKTHTGHILMVVHFLLAGYLFAWVLVGIDPGPKRWPPSLRLLILFATISFHAFFGVAMTTGSTLLAPDFYQQLHLPWAVDLLADQRTGGAVAWAVGELPTLVLAMLVTLAWVRSDAAETKRLDRQADRDDDAELKAYNAALAARAAADRSLLSRSASARPASARSAAARQASAGSGATPSASVDASTQRPSSQGPGNSPGG